MTYNLIIMTDLTLFYNACGKTPDLLIVKSFYNIVNNNVNIILTAIDNARLYNNKEILDYLQSEDREYYWKNDFLGRSMRNGSIEQFKYIMKYERVKDSFIQFIPFRKLFFNTISKNSSCFELLFYISKNYPKIKDYYDIACINYINFVQKRAARYIYFKVILYIAKNLKSSSKIALHLWETDTK